MDFLDRLENPGRRRVFHQVPGGVRRPASPPTASRLDFPQCRTPVVWPARGSCSRHGTPRPDAPATLPNCRSRASQPGLHTAWKPPARVRTGFWAGAHRSTGPPGARPDRGLSRPKAVRTGPRAPPAPGAATGPWPSPPCWSGGCRCAPGAASVLTPSPATDHRRGAALRSRPRLLWRIVLPARSADAWTTGAGPPAPSPPRGLLRGPEGGSALPPDSRLGSGHRAG